MYEDDNRNKTDLLANYCNQRENYYYSSNMKWFQNQLITIRKDAFFQLWFYFFFFSFLSIFCSCWVINRNKIGGKRVLPEAALSTIHIHIHAIVVMMLIETLKTCCFHQSFGAAISLNSIDWSSHNCCKYNTNQLVSIIL